MKLKFDPNLDYQQAAIDAVADTFRGQPAAGTAENAFSITPADTEGGQQSAITYQAVGNDLHLSESKLLENIQEIQKQNEITGEGASDALEDMNFSVEMETGTGKTYVYLRTIYKLHEEYGFSKFIIVVPSIAIREGVKKNLEITEAHLDSLYDNPPASSFVYDSARLGRLRDFATSQDLRIMVTTIQAFRGDSTVMNQYRDQMLSKPIEYVQATKPIMILDEPQNMESELSKEAIESFDPMCTLRYSATHKKPYNLLYSLDPVDAYEKNLVKNIEVLSVREKGSFDDAYISVEKIDALQTQVNAYLEIEVSDEAGLSKQEIRVNNTEPFDLYELSGQREPYRGYVLKAIDPQENYVEFQNGERIGLERKVGEMDDAIKRTQIRETIEEHLDKMLKLKGKGIKVLSLFFIDEVANYRDHEAADPEGKYQKWFEKEYEELAEHERYAGLNLPDVSAVHDGYFAKDNQGEWRNTTNGTEKYNESAYDLIMKDKERLLSDDEDLQFIFSHSALKEGWDNPNVFQICTLNETNAEMKKRQEIGRGLRIPVNQDGERVFDESLNILTIVANESYKDFARGLQTEMNESGYDNWTKDKTKNRSQRKTISVNKDALENEAFKQLWSRIKHKTRYRVTFTTDELIDKAAKKLANDLRVIEPTIAVEKGSIVIKEEGIEGQRGRSGAEAVDADIAMPIPDVLGYLEDRTNLKRETIYEIITQSGTLSDLMKNPQMYLDKTLEILSDVLEGEMIDDIRYEKIAGESYEMRAFSTNELQAFADSRLDDVDTDKTVYESVVYDSGQEKSFAKDLDNSEDVNFYVKLPRWFTIDTPLGTYNPDWAIAFDKEDKLYFVAETKGGSDEGDVRGDALKKIRCGEAHFSELDEVEFAGPVSEVDELLS